jgi:biopolymer transport protein TolR
MPKVHAQSHESNGRHRRGRRIATSLSEINVVPLVDVMLVLLIIFMVTAPMMQRGVEVNLPVARRSEAITGERIFVNVPLRYRTDRIVYLGEEPIRVEILNERMRQAMQNRSDKEVFLRGDGGVQLQELMEIMDRLKEAGVEKVGIVAKAPGER